MNGSNPCGVQPTPTLGPMCHRLRRPGSRLVTTVVAAKTLTLSSLGSNGPLTHASYVLSA